MEEEVVYAGIALGESVRWWRYADGELEPLQVPAHASAEDVALWILADFAARDPASLAPGDPKVLAAAFKTQFFVAEDNVQACFVEGHRIRTWVAVQRLCGRV